MTEIIFINRWSHDARRDDGRALAVHWPSHHHHGLMGFLDSVTVVREACRVQLVANVLMNEWRTACMEPCGQVIVRALSMHDGFKSFTAVTVPRAHEINCSRSSAKLRQ